MSCFLVLLAAGNSKRLNSAIPKPFQKVNNKTLLEHSLNAFKDLDVIKKVVVVYNKKHKKYINKIKLKNILKITGGLTRQQSTLIALRKIQKLNCRKVLIHDAARPLVSKKLIKTIIFKLKNNHAVIPIVTVNDSSKRIKNNTIFKNIDRNNLRFSQTPQGFTCSKILNKHLKYKNDLIDDDASLFVKDNEKVCLVIGDKKNFKVTNQEDLELFKDLKKGNIYYGIGFDIHKLVKNKKLYLGGLNIPFNFGLLGHSDGDPVIHALIDSLLGACKLGDIGKIFPNKSNKYKNIRSTILLRKIITLIKNKGFFINNIDINIITEAPKINKYSKKIISLLSRICEINTNQINIKGKTTEKLGIIGEHKAVASEVITSVIQNV